MSGPGPEQTRPVQTYRVVVLDDDSARATRFCELLAHTSVATFDVEELPLDDWESRSHEDPKVDVVLFDASAVSASHLRSQVDAIRRVSQAAVVGFTDHDEDDLLVQVLEAGAAGFVALDELTHERLLNTMMAAIHARRVLRRLELELDCAVHMTNYDRITNLQNRHSLERRLSPLLATAVRNERRFGVLFVETAGLKSVNDTLGLSAGNQLLRDVADRLSGTVRQGDEVTLSGEDDPEAAISHFGGGEFTVLLNEIRGEQDAARIAQRILDALADPFIVEEQEVFVSTSIGIAVFPFDGNSADALLRNAASAEIQAKKAGGNSFQFYTKSMNSEAARRLRLSSLLHRALERDEFSLHYQPMRDAATGRLLAAEALLRWSTEELGDVSPAEFIPIAEETNLIVPIGEWVLRTASMQYCRWLDATYDPFRMAVNLSGRQLQQGELAEMVARVLRDTGMLASHLELEITESTTTENDAQIRGALEDLRDMGVGLALDDFGTGFSTLTHLSSFPVDRLKIDRSFISQIESRSQGAGIASALIAMAHSLDLRVVAEGVETEGQADFLRRRGCDELQGFLLGRPVHAMAFEQFLEPTKPLA